MEKFTFDEHGRFVIPNYSATRPFSSFLPGIASPMGIPMWMFYVNCGQAIASFGVAPFSGKLSYTWLPSVDQLPLSVLKESREEHFFH
jgi:hypothetical protein